MVPGIRGNEGGGSRLPGCGQLCRCVRGSGARRIGEQPLCRQHDRGPVGRPRLAFGREVEVPQSNAVARSHAAAADHSGPGYEEAAGLHAECQPDRSLSDADRPLRTAGERTRRQVDQAAVAEPDTPVDADAHDLR